MHGLGTIRIANDEAAAAKGNGMSRMAVIGLALACCASTALRAQPVWELARLPVAQSQKADPATYTGARAVAERGGSPVEIALAVAGEFEGRVQHVIQENDAGEAPVGCRVTVLRDGLLDDAIRSERWFVVLARSPGGSWSIREATRAWRCRRGALPEGFAATRCP